VSEEIIEAPNITREEYRKYRGKDVAIYKDQIIASGRTSTESLHNAKKKCPEAKTDEIEIFYIQITDEMIL